MLTSFFLFFSLIPVAAVLCFTLYVKWRASPDGDWLYWIANLVLFLLCLEFLEWLSGYLEPGFGYWEVLAALALPYISLAALYRWHSCFKVYANWLLTGHRQAGQ